MGCTSFSTIRDTALKVSFSDSTRKNKWNRGVAWLSTPKIERDIAENEKELPLKKIS